jgi:cell division septation protein DedD
VEPAPALPPASTLPQARVPGPDGAAPGVFRVQVGAFLDHRNADRLVARLRNDNFQVVDSVSEQSRVLYRVLATPRSSEGYEAFVADIKRLGFAPELRGDSAVVTGPVSMKEAVEVSRTLRERGFRVRLERQASSGSFRVVRVGEFATAEEAERLRTQLQGRGLEGIVVRER